LLLISITCSYSRDLCMILSFIFKSHFCWSGIASRYTWVQKAQWLSIKLYCPY